jgi:parvulin-like peptidyl-prolyl isomerase
MLRILSGVRRFSERTRELIIPRLLPSGWVRAGNTSLKRQRRTFAGASGLCLFLPITGVCVLAGCSTQQFSVAEQTKSVKDQGMDLVTSASLCPASSASSAAPGNLQPDSERPNVSRLQKPENGGSKQAENGSSLDLTAYRGPTPSNGEVAASIRATVNGQVILDEEVRETIYPVLQRTQLLPEPERSARQKQVVEAALQQLIEREVILQDLFARLKERKQALEALQKAAGKEFDKKMKETKKAMHIKTDEELKAFLRTQGLTLQGVRRQIERQFMAMEYMRNQIFSAIDRIGHQQIREYYERHPEEFQVPDSVTWQDIFLDASRYPSREAARQFAVELIAKAKAGADFRQLVTQYDQGNSSYLNGEGYGHRRGEIKPADAEPMLFNMKDGDLGLVELTNGFHVIRLVKREYAGLKPLDDKTQTAVRNKLQGAVWQREYDRIVRELKRKAAIEIASN